MNHESQITEAKAELDRDNFERAHQLLEPLVNAGNAEAMFLAGCFGKPDETDAQFQKRHVASVELAAEKGDADAIYALGIFYDIGDHEYAVDQVTASQLFKKAADLGHLRCQWIHACELLWGLGTYPQDVKQGLQYLEKSIAGNFAEALETMALIHERGEFGYKMSEARAAELRAKANAGKL